MSKTAALTFELYRDDADEWRWRAVSNRQGDGVVADSSEGYPTRDAALTALQHVRSFSQTATVIDLTDQRHQFARDLTITVGGGD